MVVPHGTTPTSKASSKTALRRNKVLSKVRDVVSASDSPSQLHSEIKCCNKDERQDILREAGITMDIPVEAGVAMKAELGIPWTKLRVICR